MSIGYQNSIQTRNHKSDLLGGTIYQLNFCSVLQFNQTGDKSSHLLYVNVNDILLGTVFRG